jgi:hypothetical protein
MFHKNILKIGAINTWYEEYCHIITIFLGFFNLILIFILIIKWSVWFRYSSLVYIHLVLTTILSFIYPFTEKSQQQNNGLDIHNDIESESLVDIPTFLLPNEALPTETTNLRDSPPSYTDVGPPPNYEDVVKDLKVSIL